MNICVVSENYDIGGLQRVISDLGERLSQDHEVYFYALSSKNSYYGKEIIVSKPYDMINKYIRIGKTKIVNAISKNYDPKILYKKNLEDLILFTELQEIDILLLNGGILTSFSNEIKKKNPKVKIISWQHNEVKTYFEIYYKNILTAFKKGIKSSDAIVCLTDDDKEVYMKYNTDTYQINNPVNVNMEMISRKELNLKTVKVGFCSRYSIESKGIDYLVNICMQLPNNYEIYFAGSGTDKEKVIFKKMISDNDLENRIHLLGALKDDDLEKFYKNIDIFISTSRWEGFGLVIVEAMSYGVPIIAFENSGPKMILSSGKYGLLVEKFNIEKFTQKIISLSTNPNALKKYSQLSRERSLDFTMGNVYPKWQELIENL